MEHKDKIARLKQMLAQVAPEGRLEAVAPVEAAQPSVLEGVEGQGPPGPTEQQASVATSGLRKLQEGRDDSIDLEELLGLEAIILPRERPVYFVLGGTYRTLGAPWLSLNAPAVKARLKAAIAAVGRIELPNHPRIPYGGTGFLVGDGLMMTNRHVAQLFVGGLGMTTLHYTAGDAAIDFKRERDTPAAESHPFQVQQVLMVHPFWDMALLRVAGLPAALKPLELATDEPAPGTDVVAIGYPARDERNDAAEQDRIFESRYNVKRLQPGKLRARENIRSFEQVVSAATHDSSTLGGNSGSAIVDPATGRVVALHFAGIYLRNNYAVPALELARDARVVAAGVRFAGTLPPATAAWDAAWRRTGAAERPAAGRATAGAGSAPPPPPPTAAVAAPAPSAPSPLSPPAPKPSTWTIPLQLSITLGPVGFVPTLAVPNPSTEAMKIPVIFDGLDEREGFDADFLQIAGQRVEMPQLTETGQRAAAPLLEGGSHELKYHKFSVVMMKRRRLAMFTAANVDWREPQRLVNGAKPTRRQLTGLADFDIEQWVTDSRIALDHQLPDIFYTRDGGVFDKGHLVRRDDVAWGSSLEDMQMGNGDTYHTTNCSPQIGAFNRSNLGEDNWGDLENMVQQQTRAERAIVFSGPVLAADDRLFEGRGDGGAAAKILIRIPRRFWKIVVVKGAGTAAGAKPEAYGFVLEQDLSAVPTPEEFVLPARWKRFMRPISEIEKLLFRRARFGTLKTWDKFEAGEGAAMRESLV